MCCTLYILLHFTHTKQHSVFSVLYIWMCLPFSYLCLVHVETVVNFLSIFMLTWSSDRVIRISCNSSNIYINLVQSHKKFCDCKQKYIIKVTEILDLGKVMLPWKYFGHWIEILAIVGVFKLFWKIFLHLWEKKMPYYRMCRTLGISYSSIQSTEIVSKLYKKMAKYE